MMITNHTVNFSYRLYIILIFGFLLTGTQSIAQDFVSPGVNTNLIGVTPDDNIPDYGHKQQQEPSCIVRPANDAYIFCAFNDLRASDKPEIQGDAWIGYSMSSDKGQTWRSGLVPGFKGHPNSLDMGFGADASLVAIPGADPSLVRGNNLKQSPGLAVLNYIGGYRDSNVGVLAIQRFVENEQEDQLSWLPENEIHIVADGTSGRFIDKPAFLFIPDDPGSQGTLTESIVIEGQSEPVTVSTPTGTLIVAYAVFTGTNSVKVMVQESKDHGRTWNNASKLSEGLNEVTGVTLTAIGQGVVAIWRQRADGNNGDAIVSAFSSNAGKKWTKSELMFDLCPFDQPATGVTFRTFAFPWSANDGKRFWTFATDRRYKNDGSDITSCNVVAGAPPGIYEGVPRIVGMSSADGINWVGSTDAPTKPFVLDPNMQAGTPKGLQVMPSAFGSKGRIDIAWYDTRREEGEFGLPGNNPLALINDYWAVEADGETITSLAMVVRKADVWMNRLTANCDTGGGCDPIMSGSSVRVSRYPVAFFDDEEGGTTAYETEAHLPNHKLYASGTLAFKGDYISVASPALRKNTDSEWISNRAACGAGDIVGECTNKEDIFVAWGDNRDVRLDYDYLAYTNGEQVPFTPPAYQSAALGFKLGEKNSGSSEPLVPIKPKMTAVTESDDSFDQAVQDSEILVCSPGSATFNRSRDANIYGALIADAPSLVAPTPSKPLGSIQRTFPLQLNNPDLTNAKNFCLVVEEQPPAGRASFWQLPASAISDVPALSRLPVTVPPGSSASRALYVVAPEGSSVRIQAYEDSGINQAELCFNNDDSYSGTLQDIIVISDGNLFNSEYCSDTDNAGNSACLPPVVGSGEEETHNITLALANLQSPVLKAPVTQALNLQAPDLAALNFQNLNFQNLNFQNLNLQNLNFQNLNFQNLNFQNLPLQNLNFQNLNFQNLNFQNTTFENLNLQNLNFQNLNLQNLNFQNLNFQNLSFQNLNFQNLNFQNLNFQNLNFQNLNLQAPTLGGGDEGDTGEVAIASAVQTNDVWYQDINYIVETDANVTTTYTADIALNLDSLKNSSEENNEAVVQLIAWTPNEHTDATDDCGSTTRFDAKVISAVTLKSSNLVDVNLPTIYSDTNQNPYEGAVSFTGKPGQPVVITVRIWATGVAKDKLEILYNDWQACAENAILGCEAKGIGGLISFGASAQSCKTSDIVNLDGSTDCLDNGNEKIFQDRTPPFVNPINPPDGFTPDNLPYDLAATASKLLVTWPITGTDTDAENLTFECTIDGIGSYYPDGPPILSGNNFEVAFTYSFPAGTTPVSCAITDGNGNTTTATFDVTVNDITGPDFGTALPPSNIQGEIEATGPSGAIVDWAPVYAIDVVDGTDDPITASCVSDTGLTSGSTFPMGSTEVICTATDSTGNSSSDSFWVTVRDNTIPLIILKGAPDIRLEVGVDAYTELGALVSDVGDPLLVSAVVGGDTVNANVVNVYTVTYDATDAYGNVAIQVTRNVRVEDSIKPLLILNGDQNIRLEVGVDTYTELGASVNDDGDPLLVSATVGGVTVNANVVNVYTVTYDATDASGNVAIQMTRTVRVEDSIKPLITLIGLATMTIEANIGSFAEPGATVTDLGNPSTAVVITGNVDTTKVGIYYRYYDATDGYNEAVRVTRTIIVVDLTAPTITFKQNPLMIKTDADGGLKATVINLISVLNDNVTATDNVDPSANLTVNCSLAGQASPLSIGSYPVSCTVADMTGNSTTGSFNLEVSFRFTFNLIKPKGNIRAGSVVPLDWYYTDPVNNNAKIDSSQFNVYAEWSGVFSSNTCAGTSDGKGNGTNDAGSSQFRYSNSNQTWQYSWQTPQGTGSYLLTISPPSSLASTTCITLR
jgi:uncharacterized protein YjbI with pentapeptide repeats